MPEISPSKVWRIKRIRVPPGGARMGEVAENKQVKQGDLAEISQSRMGDAQPCQQRPQGLKPIVPACFVSGLKP